MIIGCLLSSNKDYKIALSVYPSIEVSDPAMSNRRAKTLTDVDV